MKINDQILLNDNLDIESKLYILGFSLIDTDSVSSNALNEFYKSINWGILPFQKVHDLISLGVLIYQKRKNIDSENLKSPFRDLYVACNNLTDNTFKNLINNTTFKNSAYQFKLGCISVINSLNNNVVEISSKYEDIGFNQKSLSFFINTFEGLEGYENFRLSNSVETELLLDISNLQI